MLSYQDRQIQEFLEAHQGDLAGMLERAAGMAGGHYAALTAEERRRQAHVDSFEFIHDFLAGGVDRAAIRSMITTSANPITLADDVLRMVAAFDGVFSDFVQSHLRDDPAAAQELLRRARNLIASFRANLTAVQIDCLLQHFPAVANATPSQY